MMSSQPVNGLESGSQGTSDIQDLKEIDEYDFNQQCSGSKFFYNCGHEIPDMNEPPVTQASSCSDPPLSAQFYNTMSEPMVSSLLVRCPVCGEDKMAPPANLPATPRLHHERVNFYTHLDILEAQNGDVIPVLEEVPRANVMPVFDLFEEDTPEFGSGMNKIFSEVAAMLPSEMRLPLKEEVTKISRVMKPIIKSTTSVLKAGAHEMGRQIHQVDKAPILARLDEVQSSIQKTDIPTPLATTLWNSLARTVVKKAKGMVITQQRKDQWIDRAGDEGVDTDWDNLEDTVESDPEVLKEKSRDWELCN